MQKVTLTKSQWKAFDNAAHAMSDEVIALLDRFKDNDVQVTLTKKDVLDLARAARVVAEQHILIDDIARSQMDGVDKPADIKRTKGKGVTLNAEQLDKVHDMLGDVIKGILPTAITIGLTANSKTDKAMGSDLADAGKAACEVGIFITELAEEQAGEKKAA